MAKSGHNPFTLSSVGVIPTSCALWVVEVACVGVTEKRFVKMNISVASRNATTLLEPLYKVYG